MLLAKRGLIDAYLILSFSDQLSFNTFYESKSIKCSRLIHSEWYNFRHGLHKKWNKFTIFVLHLSLCDVLYCAICLPFYASVYLGFPWNFGKTWCMLSISLAYIFAYVDWMALSLIALSRALSVCAPQFLNKTTSNLKSKIAIAIVWMFVILVMTPSFLEVKISFETMMEKS